MTFTRKVTEARPSKDGETFIRQVKLGNKLLGTIEMPKVRGVMPAATFWASDNALRMTKESILLSRVAIQGLRTYAVVWVGHRAPDGTTYKIPYNTATDPTKVDNTSHKLYVGASLDKWEIDRPETTTSVENVMSAMRISSRRTKSEVSKV